MPKPPKDLALGHLDDGDDDNDEQPRRRPSGAPEFDMMRRASKSFENLVALANDQERLNAMSKVARKAVWRDVGEPPVQLETFLECLEHASRGGLRESSFCLLGTQPPELLGGYRIERNTYTVQWPISRMAGACPPPRCCHSRRYDSFRGEHFPAHFPYYTCSKVRITDARPSTLFEH